jgi:hypothetical protein
MATLPSASVSVDATAPALASGLDFLTVIAPVATAADVTPRLFYGTDALLTRHGYAPGVDYCATHFRDTKLPVIFVGIPVATAGTIGSVDTSGNTGTSAVTLSGTPLEEVDLVVRCDAGGTIGTDSIRLSYSLDGGLVYKSLRLGTGTSVAIPRVGLTLTVVSGGTLVTDDAILTARTTAPVGDQAGIEDARVALAAQSRASRSWLLIGDLANEQGATDLLTEANLYATSHDRFIYSRAQVPDARKAPTMSKRRVAMTGAPNITFAEVGGTGDTITRATGSFITDGFAVGDVITVTGAVASAGANNVTGPIASLSATVITLGTTDLVNEGPISGVSIVGSPGITFAEVGGTGDTITRTSGSWILDGFQVGDVVTVAGSASNNVTTDAITGVSATVLTLNTTDLAAETIGSHVLTITAPAETLAECVQANDLEFTDIDDQRRIDLAHGRARELSPVLGFRLRRPSSWSVTRREYSGEVHDPSWRKGRGALPGVDLEDADGNTVEHDERITGGALAGRFTCLRTWANGPAGVYVANALTRATEDTVLSRTHSMAVTNIACSVCQAETENAIGEVLVLRTDGTATEESLGKIEQRVNSALYQALLTKRSDGNPRASSVVWAASREDVLNIPSAVLNGTLTLVLNGAPEHIATRAAVS